MKWNKKLAISAVLFTSLLSLSACQSIQNWWKNTKEEWIGLEMTVRTFDESAQLIDEMSGKSLSIERNADFDSVDAEGNSNADSSVLKVTIGQYEMDHVGSSLIAAEAGLEDLFAKYQKTVIFYTYGREYCLFLVLPEERRKPPSSNRAKYLRAVAGLNPVNSCKSLLEIVECRCKN